MTAVRTNVGAGRPFACARRRGRTAAGLVAGIVLIVACGPASISSAAPPARGAAISVVTLNLWHDKADWPARRALIVRTLAGLHPDIVALQEVLQDRDLPNQARDLAMQLGYRYTFASVDPPTAARRYGNALLTRSTMLVAQFKPLLPANDYRTAVHVRVALGTRTLDVYATHLNADAGGGAVRSQQMADLADFASATSNGGPSIMLGDFNTPANAPELGVLAKGYRDAYDSIHPGAAQDAPEHSTLNPVFNAPLRIDHVFFDSRFLRVDSARRLFDRADAQGRWASDHFGVQATLRFVGPADPPRSHRIGARR